jgi:hypothetical protein
VPTNGILNKIVLLIDVTHFSCNKLNLFLVYSLREAVFCYVSSLFQPSYLVPCYRLFSMYCVWWNVQCVFAVCKQYLLLLFDDWLIAHNPCGLLSALCFKSLSGDMSSVNACEVIRLQCISLTFVVSVLRNMWRRMKSLLEH